MDCDLLATNSSPSSTQSSVDLACLKLPSSSNQLGSRGGGKTPASTQHSNTSQVVVLNNVRYSVRGGKTHGRVALSNTPLGFKTIQSAWQ